MNKLPFLLFCFLSLYISLNGQVVKKELVQAGELLRVNNFLSPKVTPRSIVTVKSLTQLLPYILTIEQISPDQPFTGQAINFHFKLLNGSRKPISGVIKGNVDNSGFLVGTSSSNINNLAPGQVDSGYVWCYGLNTSGTHTVEVSFGDGIFNTLPASFNPNVVGSHPVLPTDTGPVVYDSHDFYVGALEPILTTPDAPATIPISPAQVCGDATDQFGESIKVLYEWGSILPQQITVASGTIVTNHHAGADFPFAHPFGMDVNLYINPDAPSLSLLNTANTPAGCPAKSGNEEFCDAISFGVANGLHVPGILGVETDSQFLPVPYIPQIGSRAVIYGNWIVDCGHPDRHTEIHPPLLTASAVSANNGLQVRATFIGRPYSITQNYSPDNSPFITHALGQVAAAAAAPGGITITAAPNIDPMPFHGTVIGRYNLFLPPQAGYGTLESSLRYHFEHRTGVQVYVNQIDKFHATVTIYMDESQYTPPPPAPCSVRNLSPEKIDSLAGWDVGTLRKYLTDLAPIQASGALDILLSFIGIPPGTADIAIDNLDASLSRGISTQSCIVQPPITPPTSPEITGSDNQIVLNDSQPWPVVGWVIFSWTPERYVLASALERHQYFKTVSSLHVQH